MKYLRVNFDFRSYYFLVNLFYTALMNESFVRHVVSFLGTIVAFLAYYSGYVSAGHGWWWTGFGVFAIYLILYKLLDV